jgi:hypothetical protein
MAKISGRLVGYSEPIVGPFGKLPISRPLATAGVLQNSQACLEACHAELSQFHNSCESLHLVTKLAGTVLSTLGNYEGYVVGLLARTELLNVINDRGNQAW